jgi:hypothetical protein
MNSLGPYLAASFPNLVEKRTRKRVDGNPAMPAAGSSYPRVPTRNRLWNVMKT